MSTSNENPSMSNEICQKCRNDSVQTCEHAGGACAECETDPNCVMLGSDCFFCLCDGEPDNIEFKGKYVLDLALDAVKLGRKRKGLGLPPPVVAPKAAWYVERLHELFMAGYNPK